MNIDVRDIEKGNLPDILPGFHTGSISYISELNDYRMYAEVWSNKRSKVGEERREIGHIGYLKTLEFGERLKHRKSDKIRFDYFAVADSISYNGVIDIYGKPRTYIQMGGVQTNTILNKIIEANRKSPKIHKLHSSYDSRYKDNLPKKHNIHLEQLDLQQDEKIKKHYFEISTNVDDISNQNQKIFLMQVLGGDEIFEKLQLLYKAGRKHIRCLFENPENITKNTGTSNLIPRLCVAWPFHETLVFDFAGRLEDYGEVCLLGTLIKASEGRIKSEFRSEVPQIDSYA